MKKILFTFITLIFIILLPDLSAEEMDDLEAIEDDFSEFTDFEEDTDESDFLAEEKEEKEEVSLEGNEEKNENEEISSVKENKKSFNPFQAPPKEEKKIVQPEKKKLKSPQEIKMEQTKLKDIISGSNILRELIENPSLSLRCKDLLKTRDSKYKHLQKIKSLNKRTQLLLKKTPPHKKIIRKKAELSSLQLQNEKKLTNFKIANIEEKIIRSGCPGIHLK